MLHLEDKGRTSYNERMVYEEYWSYQKHSHLNSASGHNVSKKVASKAFEELLTFQLIHYVDTLTATGATPGIVHSYYRMVRLALPPADVKDWMQKSSCCPTWLKHWTTTL